jgi:hypothetical protein
MEEKKRLNQDDPEQSARFIEAAERIEADSAWAEFDSAMKRITKKNELRDDTQEKNHELPS